MIRNQALTIRCCEIYDHFARIRRTRRRRPRLVAPVGTSEATTVTSTSLWANTWVWVRQVDPLHGTFRNEPRDDYYEVDTAFVSYEVPRGAA